ncbi:hypothetical protein EUX98_g6762 [Antrodiella citrinella]|uniref:Uncharacterized protein n=1 Tax=Antrodiella citrinella TaxID=2447956 RepID=A0A4S4MVP7_9APHY|nr:hypothetical protein EUX98_g6762 [Antrodiella citrinella]
MDVVPLYQLGGFRAHTSVMIPRDLAALVCPKGGIELILGVLPSGATYLLLEEGPFLRLFRRSRDRPWSSSDFRSLSPIYFDSREALEKKLEQYVHNKKNKKGQPRDRSKANTAYTLEECVQSLTSNGELRAEFELHRYDAFQVRLFRTLKQAFQSTIHDAARDFRLNTELILTVHRRLLGEIWQAMASGNAIDDQRLARWSTTAQPLSPLRYPEDDVEDVKSFTSAKVEAEAAPADDESDSDFDPNNVEPTGEGGTFIEGVQPPATEGGSVAKDPYEELDDDDY